MIDHAIVWEDIETDNSVLKKGIYLKENEIKIIDDEFVKIKVANTFEGGQEQIITKRNKLMIFKKEEMRIN